MPPSRNLSTRVAAAIRHTDLCQECIARSTKLRHVEVVLTLAEMSEAVKIVTREAPCRQCSRRDTVYRVA